MKDNKLILLLLCVVALFAMTSCSETDEDVNEFPDWRNYNSKEYIRLYDTAEQNIKNGDDSWKIFRNWTLTDEYPAQKTDRIVVEVLEAGDPNGECPMFTDSVNIAYAGKLLPSTSFPKGYVFDKSYSGAFDKETVNPMCTDMIQFVDGFTTALLNMRPGDYWRVYIPTELAYGMQVHPIIPQYSMLIFDLYLFSSYHPGKGPSNN